MEVGQTATATQNGLSAALSDADISVKNEAVVSVTMTVSKKASWNSSWWGSWGNSGAKTRVFTYTITESAAGTYKYEVYAYNADSARSETAKALTLIVMESNGSSGWWWK